MIATPRATLMAHPRQRRLALAAALAACIVARAASAQLPSIDDIRRLVETGFSGEAWPMCQEIDRDATPQADLWCGIAAVDVGRVGEGVLSIERHLLRSRAWDCAVSLAGPAANLLLGILLSIPFLLGLVDPSTTNPAWQAYAFLIVLQFSAVAFNLIPVPPFDGFQAMAAWFDEEFRQRILAHSSYAMMLVFMLFWYVDPVNRAFWRVIFNAADPIYGSPDDADAFIELYPEYDFSGIARWAWAGMRAVDYLYTLPEVDKAHIGIAGHSRNGKMALIAAALDDRITAVIASSS